MGKSYGVPAGLIPGGGRRRAVCKKGARIFTKLWGNVVLNEETTKKGLRASETFLIKRYGHIEFSSFYLVNLALIFSILQVFEYFLRI